MTPLKGLGVGLTAMAIVALPTTTLAAELDFEPGFYMLATAGNTTIDYGSGSKLGGNGYSIGMGYDINQYFAVEAEYNNYFDFEVSGLDRAGVGPLSW